MQAVCAKCSRLMCRAVVLFLVAECAQTTPMIAPLPGDPNFSIDGSVAFFKSGESNPTQPNPPALPDAVHPSPNLPQGIQNHQPNLAHSNRRIGCSLRMGGGLVQTMRAMTRMRAPRWPCLQCTVTVITVVCQMMTTQ